MERKEKKQIIKKALIIVAAEAVVLLVVLPVWGPTQLLYAWIGLACGGVASLLAFFVLIYGSERVFENGKRLIAVFSLIIRIGIYGAAVLFATLQFGYPGCAGAGLGLLSWALAVIWQNALIPMWQARKLRLSNTAVACASYEYVEFPRDSYGNPRYLFIRSHSMDIWSGGKHYVTHRKFRLLSGRRSGKDDSSVPGGEE